MQRCTVVLDVGKTNAKLSLWAGGRQVGRRARSNDIVHSDGYRALDVPGIEEWLAASLSDFARDADIGAIVPVAHGAAAALVRNGRLFAAPLDYELPIPEIERDLYLSQRDHFRESGSPRLPQGLNLGLQLHYLEHLMGPWPHDVRILPWPQYWAWRLSGVPASEVTSLGCHTDLWRPRAGQFSELAHKRGWARRFPPLRRAAEVLAPITSEWVSRTGLPSDCAVLCGLHDSNAALHAARGHADLRDGDVTVLSTGTWFVAMRSDGEPVDLHEERDCLINVDVAGRPVLSSRFMGGREAELIADNESTSSIARLSALLERGAAALPTFVSGCGPFPRAVGTWSNKPDEPADQRAIADLYLALMSDECLNLIGSRDTLLIEGRFAQAPVFTRALAALRPTQNVYICDVQDDASFGALRLLDPTLQPAAVPIAVEPLDVDFRNYAAQWRAHASRSRA